MYLFRHNLIRSALVLSVAMGIAVYAMDEKQCRQARELVQQQERQWQEQERARQRQLALQVQAPEQPAGALLRAQAQELVQQAPEAMRDDTLRVIMQKVI